MVTDNRRNSNSWLEMSPEEEEMLMDVFDYITGPYLDADQLKNYMEVQLTIGFNLIKKTIENCIPECRAEYVVPIVENLTQLLEARDNA